MKQLLASFFTLALLLPGVSSASSSTGFSVSAWIPYWKTSTAVPEASAHLAQMTEISPFAFEVKPDGTLVDKLKISQEPWASLLAQASSSRVKVIPSVMWADGSNIHKILSKASTRRAHEDRIVQLVQHYGFAGIDIDYESKKTATKPYFSAFIKSLAGKLHAKRRLLSCTIEPRTPLSSRFKVIPKKVEYANDFAVLNKYCDQVRIMAYGQGNVDIKLSQAKGQFGLYAPVADPDWVAKVIQETRKSISAKKLVVGIPSYGYEYEVGMEGSLRSYRTVRSITYKDAMELAAQLNVVPARNGAGELSFAYATTTAALASAATGTVPALSARLVWFTDAASASGTITVAKKFGLKGVALFKVDDENDPLLWSVLR